MMAMLLGKKVGITQVYGESGKLLPVTVIQAGPCVVMQVKTAKTDGYSAVQLGFEDKKSSRARKPQIGSAAKAKTSPKRFVREMRLADDAAGNYELGASITVGVFADNKYVDVVGTSKGKGYAGVMKRYGFGGFPASHGTERRHRAPGSIASFATDRGHSGKLKKGKRMAGRMGGCRVTAKNHKLIGIDQDRNLLIVKGSVPGPDGGYCIVRTAQKK
ncbi:MAG: 50S ribosomal protein L3 [Sedimentisphaerales bacterium]|nr:50S ribosomal protein L3 [Sedimentisphaerales bacterium]